MMADTPSNYNIPNGRLDGKSLGLKALLMHAKKVAGNAGQTLDAAGSGPLWQGGAGGANTPTAQAQVMSAAAIRNRIGGQSQAVGGNVPGRGEGQVDRSMEGGWQNLNQPLRGPVMEIGEESSGREYTSGGAPVQNKKKKKVPTTKTFAEGNNGTKNITPKPGKASR
jgi:hypothetical protein